MSSPLQTPQNNHGRRSKRRRLDSDLSAESPAILRYIPTRTSSPDTNTRSNESTENRPSQEERPALNFSSDDESIRYHTQPPDVAIGTLPRSESSPLPPPPSIPTPKTIRAPPLLPFDSIPESNRALIRNAIKQTYGFDSMRDFQVEAINHLVFGDSDDTYMVLIRRTADGKSLVPMGTAAMLRKVSIVLVPLHGLGSDQVSKTRNNEKNISAYYVDEHKREDYELLRERLQILSMEEAMSSTTILYVSPKALLTESPWIKVFKDLRQRNLISLIAIDEAHTVNQSGRHFRTEFISAMNYLHCLQEMGTVDGPSPIPRLAMSATFREEDRNKVTDILGGMEPNIVQGDLSRRTTKFSFIVSGDSAKSLYSSAERDLTAEPDAQQLWYSNSAEAAETTMLEQADKMLQRIIKEHGNETIVQSFTGRDGLMMKTTTITAFTNYSILSGEAKIDDNGNIVLPKIQVLIATSAANAGISSNSLRFSKHKDLPSNLYDLVQEMGRVNRDLVQVGCSYEIHASFQSVIERFVQCMQSDAHTERQELQRQSMEVLRFLMVPRECYHSFVERHFEVEPVENKFGCGNMCSFCDGDHIHYTGRFYMSEMQSLLSSLCMRGNKMVAKDFIQMINKKKNVVFHKEDIPSTMGPIHALAMQLICNNIVSLTIGDSSKIGTKRIKSSDVMLQLEYMREGDGPILPAYTITSAWKGLQTV